MKFLLTILNKPKCLFSKTGEQEGKAGPDWGVGTSEGGRI
jgi:hypothetical protein